MGSSNTMQTEQRRAAAAASQAPRAGKELDLVLALADGASARNDPAHLIHEGPILACARACWESWFPAKLRNRNFKVVSDKLNDTVPDPARPDHSIKKSKWGSITGPFVAVFLTITG